MTNYPTEWETCFGCGDEFLAGHICRDHSLCGLCHPVYDQYAPLYNMRIRTYPCGCLRVTHKFGHIATWCSPEHVPDIKP